MGQGAAFHGLFQRIDIAGFKLQLTTVQIGGIQARPLGVEAFHEGLQFRVFAPDELGAFALISAFFGFDICVLIEAHNKGSFPSWLERCLALISDLLVLACFPPLGEGLPVSDFWKTPRLPEGRAGEGKARPASGRRFDTGGRSGEIGRDPRLAREEPDFSVEAGAERDTRAPVRGAGRMAGGHQGWKPASRVRAERRPG